MNADQPDFAGKVFLHSCESMPELPDKSIQCCVTSPPFFGLRDYGTGRWAGGDSECEHDNGGHPQVPHTISPASAPAIVSGGNRGGGPTCVRCGATRVDEQIGLEDTPEKYVDRLVKVFREVHRVLRDDGTLWLNLGDSYATGAGKVGQFPGGGSQGDSWVGRDRDMSHRSHRKGPQTQPNRMPLPGLKPKDLIGIPWRVAFALQSDGWWLRSDIVWCLSGGTYVYARTKKGDGPAMVRDISRLPAGSVELWNGERWTRLLGMSRSKRASSELEIILRSGERISCTPTHRFPTNRGLLTASDLCVGDSLVRTILPEPAEPLDSEHIGADAAWFVGLYIAEGSRSGTGIRIDGHISEDVRWRRLRKLAEDYGSSTAFEQDGNGATMTLYGGLLEALLRRFVSGEGAKGKCLAPVCWKYSNRFLSALLQGYLDGDGHYDARNQRWRLGFARNYNLERDFRCISARLGATLTLNFSHASFAGRRFPSFRGELRFARTGHRSERSREEIVAIRKARCRELYDLGVEHEPHLFALSTGVLTHNSKPGVMPESVADRPTRSHEYLFLFAKNCAKPLLWRARDTLEWSYEPDLSETVWDPQIEQDIPRWRGFDYYYDGDAIKEPLAEATFKRVNQKTFRSQKGGSKDYREERRNTNRSARNTCENMADGLPQALEPTAPLFPGEVPERTVAVAEIEAEIYKAGFPSRKIGSRIYKTDAHNRFGKRSGNRVWEDDGAMERMLAGKNRRTVWTIATRPFEEAHFAVFPVELPSMCIRAGSPPGSVVLDPFAGSGTTFEAAEVLGRLWTGYELQPHYLPIIRKRTAQLGLGMT